MKSFLWFLLSAFLLISSGAAEASRHSSFGGGHHFSFKKQKSYQVYQKTHRHTGQVYIGRTSGRGTPDENIRVRDRNHHRNKDGFGQAKLLHTSANKHAIRGQEQRLIAKHRAAGTGADQINGVGPYNPRKNQYSRAAEKEFPGKSKIE